MTDKNGKHKTGPVLLFSQNSFRHLLNTEILRLDAADMIITKRFNRRNVQRSDNYDHVSLAKLIELCTGIRARELDD
jgi:hypothetical protein